MHQNLSILYSVFKELLCVFCGWFDGFISGPLISLYHCDRLKNQDEPQTVVHPDTQASSGEGVFCFLPIIQFYQFAASCLCV